jgi:glycosyltransferase involved in cell wall biosynthesis
MVVYSYYPMDQRVRREAMALTENGAHVHVIALRNEFEVGFESHNDVSVYRIPQRLSRRGGYLFYFLRYLLFLMLSSLVLSVLHARYKYNCVHVHSLPDYLVFCAAVPKLLGASIVLDLHELMPEVFATKFDSHMKSRGVYIARIAERISLRFADRIITTSESRKKTLLERANRSDITVVMNLPKKNIFKSRNMDEFIADRGLADSYIVGFMGGLNPEREINVVIRAIKYLEERIPNIALIICGTGEKEYVTSLVNLTSHLNLREKVLFLGFVPQDDVLNYMALSDVVLSPYKIHPNMDAVSSTKVFEYLLIPRFVIVADYPNNRQELSDMVLFYKSSDHRSLAESIQKVFDNPEEYQRMAERAQRIIFERYDSDRNEENLLSLYRDLIER